MKTPIAFIALLFSGAAMAEGPGGDYREFTRDGITYHYRTIQRGRHQAIIGRDSQGDRFVLRVSGSRVSGRYGPSRVAFAHPAARFAESED